MVATKRAFTRHDLHQARTRVAIALAVGLGAAWAMPSRLGGVLRAVAGWDAGALVIGVLSWTLILRANADRTRRHAADEDPGRRAAWVLLTLASSFALVANAAILHNARACVGGVRDLYIGLCLGAVVSAWLLTHTAYTLRYAHLYYRDDGEGEGGLTFPGSGKPAYLEFAYFAFTVGMCFQVSDVTVTSRPMRRAVLGQSLLSFAYNTAVLATAVSLVVGILG